MLTIIADAPSNSGRMCVVRCVCGREYEMPRRRVPRTESCGCAMKRPPRVKVELPPVEARLVPASKWMSAPLLAEAILDTYRPIGDRLENMSPVRIDALCAAIGCEPHHVCRWEFAAVLEWSATHVYGVRCPASLVFGPRDDVRLEKAA